MTDADDGTPASRPSAPHAVASSHPASRNEEGNGVQVIARAARVLRALEGEPLGLSLTQIAERVHLPRSTVHRIVTALAAEGFLASASPSGRVHIGPEFARLATAGTAELWRPVEPYMTRLAGQLGETVDCAILDGSRVRVVQVIPASRHTLRAVAEVGQTLSLYSSSQGKALLAQFDPATVARMLPVTFDRFTPHTLTSAAEIAAELELVRRTCIAYDKQESALGVSTAATALRVPSGTTVAISVIVPSQRYGELADEVDSALTDLRRQVLREHRTPPAPAP